MACVPMGCGGTHARYACALLARAPQIEEEGERYVLLAAENETPRKIARELELPLTLTITLTLTFAAPSP